MSGPLIDPDPDAAQAACTEGFHGGSPPQADEVTCPACGHAFRPADAAVRATEGAAQAAGEALIDGRRSVADIKDLVRAALVERIKSATGVEYAWVYIADLTVDGDAGQVVYSGGDDSLFQCSYGIAGDGAVTLGEPMSVAPTYVAIQASAPEVTAPAAGADSPVTEARARIPGRVIEAKGTTADGGRIFRVRVIQAGDSLNGRRYPLAVLQESVGLYEGAKAYDHHRSDEEMRSGTIAGLVGYYRNATSTAEGIEADLHLLPSATRAAEALDASIEAQAVGLPVLVGLSHDVMACFKAVAEGGRHVQEATAIVKVNSADVVADPAAGGQATRVVAGGTDPDPQDPSDPNSESDPAGSPPEGESTKEPDVTVTTEGVLAALKSATPEQLAAHGLTRAQQSTESSPPTEPAPPNGDPQPSTPPPPDPQPTTPQPTPAEPGRTEETMQALGKNEFLGRLLVQQKVADAGLPAAVTESLITELPDRITESMVDQRVAGIKASLSIAERAGLTPTASVQVTQESRDKKVAALDAFFAGQFGKGYHSFREAFIDFTGARPRMLGEDFNRTILRECWGGGFDGAQRAPEALDSTSWAQVLGDSITRRLVAEYSYAPLQSWRQIVSSIVPVNDFRTQRVDRIGGYGTLPVVNEGAPYQPLTSPPDEEATYALTKKGGTEDLTLEMIANDDVRAISNIPRKLGRAAAQTLYRFVWDFLRTNATCTYDSVALFHASHANTANPAVLSETTLSAARVAMEQQTAYGDSTDLLSLTPRFLIIPPNLETLAFKLTRSAVAVTSGEDATTPNIHEGTTLIRVDYFTDTNDWYAVADPGMAPTLEIGFYQGREEPELFTQADQNQGSVFNADKITHKIRHIYNGTVIDHRAFYRGAN